MIKQEEWRIIKFWDANTEVWNYEVAYWIDDDFMGGEEYFESKKEAELYIEKMKKEKNK